MKKKAAEIAATFEKQGMSAADAMKKAWQQITDDAVRGSTKTKTSISGIKAAFSSLGSTVSRLGGLLTSVLGPISFIWLAKECIELGSSVSEVQNVVDTAFGSMSHKMEAFADTAITSFGMSELAAKKTGSTYMAMAKGIGIADGAASDMAITLTGLSGDVASFYNISQDLASTKLKSVFTGETETLKDLGVVMTQTNLEQYALSRGISKSISAMTQAELATLRYNFVLDSLNLASGDFVKTQDSWANQTRILSMQMQALGANVGQILTTVLLPAVKTLNEIVANLVSATSIISAAISSIFGVQISQNSQIASTAAEAAEAENNLAAGISNAAKAAKKSLAGFDDLNILQSNDSSSGGGGGAGGGGIDMSMSNETSVTPGEGLDTAKVGRVAEIIKEIAGYVPVIAAGLAGLKLGKFITDLLTANIEAKTLKETIALLGKKAGLTLGITLAITGLSLEIKGISDAVQEGLNGINFAEIIGGGGALAAGGALVGKFFGSAIIGGAVGAIVGGVGAVFAGIYDACVDGIDWLSAALTAIGTTAIGAGIGALIGSVGGPLGALIGLGVGLVIDGIIYLVQVIIDNWESISAWFSEVFATIGQWFADLWQGIVDIWNVCAEWFNTNVIQPVVGFFVGLWEGISTAASECWAAIVEFFTPAFVWFSELFGSIWQTLSDIFYNIGVIASGCWEIIKAVWAIVSEWFNTNIIQPVAGFFTNLWTSISNWAIGAWESIKSVFSTIGNWINTNIIQPVSNFFSGLWNGFLEKARAAWEGVKTVFGKVASFFSDTFEKAWAGIVKIFSIAGDIFNDIKDGILTAFKSIVNGIIKGLNSAIAVPFNGINWALNKIKSIEIVGITPFSGLKTINVPQIPYLAQGAVLPPNKPFMAVVGDQKSGVNVEAPLATIQDAVAIVMEDMVKSNMAGHEATVSVLREILEAVLGIEIGDDIIGRAAIRYNRTLAVVRGGC